MEEVVILGETSSKCWFYNQYLGEVTQMVDDISLVDKWGLGFVHNTHICT